jgi:hypothetical protein
MKKSILLTLLFLITFPFATSAVQIQFGSTTFATNYTSHGSSEPMGCNFIFALGAFDPGFTPTANNMDEWNSRWTALSKTAYNATTRLFQSTATLSANATPFTTVNRGYIWGFRNSGGRNEWILMSNPAWKWPFASGTGFPVDWNVTQATDLVVGEVGGVGFEMKSADTGDQLTSPYVSPSEWMSLYPMIGNWNGDFDHDGLDNLTEYALGLCPKSAEADSASSSTIEEVGGKRFLSLSVNRPKRLFVTYVVEFSSDLVTWLPGSVVSDTELSLHVRDSKAVTSSLPHRFVRLRVSIL